MPTPRPKGARSKLSESFLKALSEDFAANGIEVIEKVRSDRPHEYLKIVAAFARSGTAFYSSAWS